MLARHLISLKRVAGPLGDSPPMHYNATEGLVDAQVRAGRGEVVAFTDDRRSITRAELGVLCGKVAGALEELGVRGEERVALLMLDSIEMVGAFLGAIKLGAVPVPINTLLRPADLLYILRDCSARVLVVTDALWSPLAEHLAELSMQGSSLLPAIEHVVVVPAPSSTIATSPSTPAATSASPTSSAPGAKWAMHAWPALLERAPERKEAAATSAHDPAFWLYSSGTTGAPKGAIHLHDQMAFCAEHYGKGVLGLGPADRALSAAKLFFAYGLGNSLYLPLYAGAQSLLVSGRPTPEAMFAAIGQYRPTVFFGVPTLYASMLDYDERSRPGATQENPLSSVRVCVSAGEALPADIFRRWKERFGVEILDGIGSTEALHIFISNRAGSVRPGTSGTVVPGYEVTLRDGDDQPVVRGEIGNLWVRGGSIMSGYYGQEEKTRQTLEGAWLRTGDKYHEDDDGYFHYHGRGDDLLKVGGIWVSPTEVESALISHPAVLEAAVVGAEDDAGLTKPRAFVVLKDRGGGGDDIARELKGFVKSRLAPYKYPRWIEFLPELPKTATGKIQRYRLRQYARPAQAQ